MSKDYKGISRFLSYVLRHRPDEIGLTLDANGWASVSELIERSESTSTPLTTEILAEVVATSDKQRFALSEDGTRIRANQGHSIAIDLGLQPAQPPEILFHGTASRFIDSIRRDGLKPMSRQHVHLSLDEPTAMKVGQRHGKPVVLRVRAGEMWRSGLLFVLAENDVWLTSLVAPEFIEM